MVVVANWSWPSTFVPESLARRPLTSLVTRIIDLLKTWYVHTYDRVSTLFFWLVDQLFFGGYEYYCTYYICLIVTRFCGLYGFPGFMLWNNVQQHVEYLIIRTWVFEHGTCTYIHGTLYIHGTNMYGT